MLEVEAAISTCLLQQPWFFEAHEIMLNAIQNAVYKRPKDMKEPNFPVTTGQFEPVGLGLKQFPVAPTVSLSPLLKEIY